MLIRLTKPLADCFTNLVVNGLPSGSLSLARTPGAPTWSCPSCCSIVNESFTATGNGVGGIWLTPATEMSSAS